MYSSRKRILLVLQNVDTKKYLFQKKTLHVHNREGSPSPQSLGVIA